MTKHGCAAKPILFSKDFEGFACEDTLGYLVGLFRCADDARDGFLRHRKGLYHFLSHSAILAVRGHKSQGWALKEAVTSNSDVPESAALDGER